MHDALPIGHQIGPYRIEEFLGEGASSRVYRARNGDEVVALKMLKVYSRALRQNLERECRVLSRMSSPFVVGCRGLVEEAGQLGIVLELVPGPSLATLLARGRLPLSLATELGSHVIQAVIAAHAAGLVHRDIKPSNILSVGRSAKLGDFGLVVDQVGSDRSPSTSSGLLGTPRYMAPEQLRETPLVDARSDLFSLGVVLYELVCGCPPFQGDKLSVFLASARGEFVRPRTRVASLTESIDRAIVAALEPDPDQRVPDAATLLKLWNGEVLSWERPPALPYLPNVGDSIESAPAFLAKVTTPITPPTVRKTVTPASAPMLPPAPLSEGRFVPGTVPAQEPSRSGGGGVGVIALLLVVAALLLVGVAGTATWVLTRPAASATPAPVAQAPAPAPEPEATPAPVEPVATVTPPPALAAPVAPPPEVKAPEKPKPAPARPSPKPAPVRPMPTVVAPVTPVAPDPVPPPPPAPPSGLGGGSDLKSPWSNK